MLIKPEISRTIVFLDFMVLILIWIVEGNDNIGCLPTQYVELGRPGYINCTFPSEVFEVFWYDDVSGRSSVRAIIEYEVGGNVRRGSGIESGEYSVLSNGALVITDVTLRNERQFKVITCTQTRCDRTLPLISVKVIVYPSAKAPSIPSCNAESPCTVSVTHSGNPPCQFYSARPPVDLEWVEHVSGKDTHVSGQVSFSKISSDGVTSNSFSVLNETITNDRLLAVYTCKPTWSVAGLLTERKVLFDYTDDRNLSNLPIKDTVYYEMNRRSELRCKYSKVTAIVWKKISPSGTVQTIGYKFEEITHTNSEFAGDAITITFDGSLQFSSLQLHNEGTYVCIYDDGRGENGIQSIYLQVLVPPSPPYIRIRECQEDGPCELRGVRSGSLTCDIYGVRPKVNLSWVATNKQFVTHRFIETVIENRGQLTDISKSIHYELANDVDCGTSVELKCEVGHPISQIIKPYAGAVIYADGCTDLEDGDDEDRKNSHSIVFPAVLSLGVCSLIIALTIMILCWRIHFLKRQPIHNEVGCSTLMLEQANGHGTITSKCIGTEERGHQDEHREDEGKKRLTHSNVNGALVQL